jgi:hypothetical protein
MHTDVVIYKLFSGDRLSMLWETEQENRCTLETAFVVLKRPFSRRVAVS